LNLRDRFFAQSSLGVGARYRHLKNPHDKGKRPSSSVGNLIAAE